MNLQNFISNSLSPHVTVMFIIKYHLKTVRHIRQSITVTKRDSKWQMDLMHKINNHLPIFVHSGIYSYRFYCYFIISGNDFAVTNLDNKHVSSAVTNYGILVTN